MCCVCMRIRLVRPVLVYVWNVCYVFYVRCVCCKCFDMYACHVVCVCYVCVFMYVCAIPMYVCYVFNIYLCMLSKNKYVCVHEFMLCMDIFLM